jgi:hypothetical protein
MAPEGDIPRKFPKWFIFYIAGILIGAGVCIFFLLSWASRQKEKEPTGLLEPAGRVFSKQ